LIGTPGGKSQSYPVEAKAWIKEGANKLTLGYQFVPFGIYKWNNLYNPFLDVPGQIGRIWDADWGALYTYDAKPLNLNIGYFDNSGEQFGTRKVYTETAGVTTLAQTMRRENAEKNTFAARLGYDILSNLNVGVSYMNGYTDEDLDILSLAQTKNKSWAIDSTWGIVPNLQFEAEFAGFKQDSPAVEEGTDSDGNYGLAQLKYDILKVPAPLDKISLVLEYSWLKNDDDTVTPTDSFKIKNYQEEISFKVSKNLDIFFQNVQQKYSDSLLPAGTSFVTDKFNYLAVKYSFQ